MDLRFRRRTHSGDAFLIAAIELGNRDRRFVRVRTASGAL